MAWWWPPHPTSTSSLQWLSSILLVILSLLLVGPTAAFYCPFDDETCLDGLAQTSVHVDFQSLFRLPVGFYYGFDAQQQGDADSLTLSNDSSASTVKLSYWLQYDSDLTGAVGAGNNGCDGVWGPKCSSNLKNFLRLSIYGLSLSGITYESPLKAVLEKLVSKYSPPTVPGCPPSLFAVDEMPVHAFVQENALYQSIDVVHPGNSSAPWQTLYIRNQTALQQALQQAMRVVVGILSRAPTYGSTPPQSADDVQVELVCARAPKHHRPQGPSTEHLYESYVEERIEINDVNPGEDHRVEYYARMVQEDYEENLYDDDNDEGDDDDDEDCDPPEGEFDDNFMT